MDEQTELLRHAKVIILRNIKMTNDFHPDVEFCDVCGAPVELVTLPSYSLSVPLCTDCWIENQRGE